MKAKVIAALFFAVFLGGNATAADFAVGSNSGTSSVPQLDYWTRVGKYVEHVPEEYLPTTGENRAASDFLVDKYSHLVAKNPDLFPTAGQEGFSRFFGEVGPGRPEYDNLFSYDKQAIAWRRAVGLPVNAEPLYQEYKQYREDKRNWFAERTKDANPVSLLSSSILASIFGGGLRDPLNIVIALPLAAIVVIVIIAMFNIVLGFARAIGFGRARAKVYANAKAARFIK